MILYICSVSKSLHLPSSPCFSEVFKFFFLNKILAICPKFQKLQGENTSICVSIDRQFHHPHQHWFESMITLSIGLTPPSQLIQDECNISAPQAALCGKLHVTCSTWFELAKSMLDPTPNPSGISFQYCRHVSPVIQCVWWQCPMSRVKTSNQKM